MKAFKEKRISLRSLWRGSLVILSLLALIFASCGSSDDGDTTTPGSGAGGDSAYTGRLPVGIQLVKSGGPATAYEGQDVDLTGFTFMIVYNTGDTEMVTDPKNIAVLPHIYDCSTVLPNGSTGTNANYTTIYRTGGMLVQGYIFRKDLAGTIRPLIDVDYTGMLAKREYFVDEIPDFRGIRVEGVYGGSTGLPSIDGAGTEYNFVHKDLAVTNRNEWVWVNNIANGFFVNDSPGVLVKIGSFGDLSAGPDSPDLTGLRIPVDKLYQVEGIQLSGQLNAEYGPVFLDDPRLIGPKASADEWTDLLKDYSIQVSYTGTEQTKTLSVFDLRNFGLWGGLWGASGVNTNSPFQLGSLEFVFLEGAGNNLQRYYWYPDRPNYGVPLTGVKRQIEPNQWTSWSLQREPRVAITYRGKEAEIPVRVFNRLNRIEVAPVDGNQVEMAGFNVVYHRPDLLGEFRGKVKVTATYALRADVSVTAVRDDVHQDFTNGKVWATWVSPEIPSVYDPYGNMGILTTENSTTYVTRGKTQRANITFTAFTAIYKEGDDENSPSANRSQRTRIDVGMRDY